MPVRIYEIAKKLGLENKVVLVKAKELGITGAKVPSSSLDKITAEYLEQILAPLAPPPPPPPPQAPTPAPTPEVVQETVAAPAPVAPPVVTEPTPAEPVPSQPAQTVMESAPVLAAEPPSAEPAPEPAAPAPEPPVPAPVAEPVPVPAPEPSSPAPAAPISAPTSPPQPESVPTPQAEIKPAPEPAAPPPPPPPPPAPKIGEKVGFIQLPTRPRPPEKPAPQKPQAGRPGDRGDNRPRQDARGGQGRPGFPPGRPGQQFGRPGQHPGRPGQMPAGRDRDRGPGQQSQQRGQAPAARPADRFQAPADGELISMKPPIVVRDLAERLKQKPFKIIADLMEAGVFANVNQSIEESIAQRICGKYGFRFEVEKRKAGAGVVHKPEPVKAEIDEDDKPENLKSRAPVVTIMGHVDHGKTTLLDGIRKSDVAAGEAGGITQHIGAYTISVPHPERKGELQQITFLDTPGHAAFSAMRARGANVTDIVILVVAANDGVMPQTLEALSHAQAAKVPILVAVNKCDHPNANPMLVRKQLQEKGLIPDEWGGNTFFVDCSAITKQGVNKLLEMICFQADLLELKANPERPARGNVIESGLQPGGPTATVLVRRGTLHVGDTIICGQFYGKVRALISEDGQRMKQAGPSHAVKVLGLNGVPEAGHEFGAVEDERAARDLAEARAMELRVQGQEAKTKVTLENLFATLAANEAKVLKTVVKADTQGSVEAIVEAIKKIESEKVSLEIIHSAVGTITESDVTLAAASNAVILGFHTRIDTGVADQAKHYGVQIKLYSIIYELIDHVKDAMSGLLDPITREVVIGQAEVRQVFALSKGLPVAGSIVNSGRIVRGKVRVLRRKNLIYEGVTQSLRRFQDEVNEVRAGMECGIRIEGFSEIQVGDTIECYTLEKVVQKL